jgi:hypothetical protein
LFVFDINPACRRHIDRFKLAIDPVLVLKTVRDDVELQRPDRAQYQVVIAQRPE